MAKIESGKLTLNEKIVYIKDKQNSFIEIFLNEAAKKDIKIISSLEPIDLYLWQDEQVGTTVILTLEHRISTEEEIEEFKRNNIIANT